MGASRSHLEHLCTWIFVGRCSVLTIWSTTITSLVTAVQLLGLQCTTMQDGSEKLLFQLRLGNVRTLAKLLWNALC